MHFLPIKYGQELRIRWISFMFFKMLYVYKKNSAAKAVRLIFAAFIICCVYNAFSKPRDNAANVGFQLLEEPVNPVLLGMGSAGAGMPSRGFAYYNPALPALQPAPYFTVEFGGYPAGDLRTPLFETAWPFDKFFFGLSIFTAAVDDIHIVDPFGDVVADAYFSWQTTDIALSLGLKRADVFGAGLCVSGIQERIHEYEAYALSVSAGVIYSPIARKLTLGFSAFHLGTTTSMGDTTLDWGEGARLPKSARFGISWIDTIKTIGYAVAADVVFRNADKRVMVPVGLEINPFKQVFLRAGKRINHDTELFNLGCGVDIAPLSCDASFVIPRLVEDTELKWRVGITYTLKPLTGAGRKKKVSVAEGEAGVIAPARQKPDTAIADTGTEVIGVEDILEEKTEQPQDSASEEAVDTVSSQQQPPDSAAIDTLSAQSDIPDSTVARAADSIQQQPGDSTHKPSEESAPEMQKEAQQKPSPDKPDTLVEEPAAADEEKSLKPEEPAPGDSSQRQ
jgi:hypothetical protein